MDKKSADPLVSVVLPFYNAPFLKQAIESILRQTWSEFELILIDNASTDNSLQIAQEFCTHAHVRLLNEPRKGVVYAANKGIRNAKGKYIARMDADDISMPDRLMLQVEILESRLDLDGVAGLVAYLGDAKRHEGFLQYISWLNSVRDPSEIQLSRFIEFPVANPSLMLRREVFEKHGLYRMGDFPEDYEFFLRIMEAGLHIGKVQEEVLSWRDLSTRLTRTDDRYSTQAFFRLKAKFLAKWLKKNNPLHPDIWVWGAGRVSRRRSELLQNHDIAICNFIDIKSGKNIIDYKDIPAPGCCFIVSYVSNRGARDKIRTYLKGIGYKEGVHFILAS